MISSLINYEQLYDLINKLYTHFDNKDTFTTFIHLCKNSGYKVVGKYVDDKLVAILGYRLLYKFAFGKYIYIDDLITQPECRSKGYGTQLIDWIKEESKRIGCNQVHLDINVINHLGLKFYLNNGFQARAYHLACKV